MENKIIELLDKGYGEAEIIENIFLNYSSHFENDNIYLIKKRISENFSIDLNNIKLIGSAHSGIKNDTINNVIEKKEEPHDLDFAIIDSEFFSRILTEIRNKQLVKYFSSANFYEKLYYGKIHLVLSQVFRHKFSNLC